MNVGSTYVSHSTITNVLNIEPKRNVLVPTNHNLDKVASPSVKRLKRSTFHAAIAGTMTSNAIIAKNEKSRWRYTTHKNRHDRANPIGSPPSAPTFVEICRIA